MREIQIRKVLNGFQVQVGCQSLVFQDKTVMIAELSRYIDHPEEIEKEYLTRFDPNGKLTGLAAPQPPQNAQEFYNASANTVVAGTPVYR